MPVVKVTATDVDRNASASTSTDSGGKFVFQQLLPASYTITVEAPGFRKFTQRDIVLNVNDRLSLGNLVLQLGSTEQVVDVVAQGQQLQTESAERAATIVGTQLQNIEVDGRSALSLMRTIPGVVINMDTSRLPGLGISTRPDPPPSNGAWTGGPVRQRGQRCGGAPSGTSAGRHEQHTVSRSALVLCVHAHRARRECEIRVRSDGPLNRTNHVRHIWPPLPELTPISSN